MHDPALILTDSVSTPGIVLHGTSELPLFPGSHASSVPSDDVWYQAIPVVVITATATTEARIGWTAFCPDAPQ